MLSQTVSLQGSNKLTSHVTILIMLHVLHGKVELGFSQHIKECYTIKPWRQTSCGQPNANHAGRKDKGNTFKHIYACPQALYPAKWYIGVKGGLGGCSGPRGAWETGAKSGVCRLLESSVCSGLNRFQLFLKSMGVTPALVRTHRCPRQCSLEKMTMNVSNSWNLW